jgi:hypothetical protein
MMIIFAAETVNNLKRCLIVLAPTEEKIDRTAEDVGKIIDQGAGHGEDGLHEREDGVDDAGKDLEYGAYEIGERLND